MAGRATNLLLALAVGVAACSSTDSGASLGTSTRSSDASVTSVPVDTPASETAPGTTVPVGAGDVPVVGGCQIFPADNAWNQRIDDLPVLDNSAAIIERLPGELHPDFGGDGLYGIPFVVVPPEQPLVPIEFRDGGEAESDPGPYPFPLDAPVENDGEGDAHVIALQQGEPCRLYELANSVQEGDGWSGSWGAVFDLGSNDLRPLGWTSADAAGLPILPGLVRYDEVAAGRIAHAIRVTFEQTQRGYILPATHFASDDTDPDLPPMGLRLRLRADYDLSGLTGQARVIATALKEYGLIVADNGSNWYVTGERNTGWDDDDLRQLASIPGSAFEAVDTGEILR